MTKLWIAAASTAAILAFSLPAIAQEGGGAGGAGGGVTNAGGTGDAAAQNLPSTVGVGNQSGNGYYAGPGGGERASPGGVYRNGDTIIRAPVPPGKPSGSR